MAPSECSPSDLLLEWYDGAARTLPWRVSPAERVAGTRPDPYAVWLSEIMLQQTTVATVGPYFRRFLATWPTVEALAAAPADDVLAAWAGLGYYARARNMIKCARVVAEDLGGRFPETEEGLLALPGVGPYTAAAIAAIAFDAPAVVVDGNVERVVSRLRRIEKPLPDAKSDIKAAAADLTPMRRAGDYAQAVMDLGSGICTPKRPACGICPWMTLCDARRFGDPEVLPRKRPKAAKPTRRGVAYVLRDGQGRVLLERRPEKGLLGGMLGVPGTAWSTEGPTQADLDGAEPRAERGQAISWRLGDEAARHTFTHFHLILELRVGHIAANAPKMKLAQPIWAAPEELPDLALPTLMRKALRLGFATARAA